MAQQVFCDIEIYPGGYLGLKGATSGLTKLKASAVAGTTTVTLPAVTDTLVAKTTTDILTNKTLTSPVLSNVSTPTSTQGTIWFDSTSLTFEGFSGKAASEYNIAFPAVLFTGSASKASTTAIQTVSMIPTLGVGSMTVKANSMVVGKTYRLKLIGFMNTPSSGQGNLTWRISIGSVALGASSALAVAASLGDAYWELNYIFRVAAVGTGTTANVFGGGYVQMGSGASTVSFWPLASNTVSGGFDSTADQLLDVTLQTSTAVDTITTSICTLEMLN